MGFFITIAVLAISFAGIWMISSYRRNRLEVRVFDRHEPLGTRLVQPHPANSETAWSTPKVRFSNYDQYEEGKSYFMRGGKSVATDAVFDAWTSGDLNAMVAALKLKTRPVDRHHLLNCLVEASYKCRDDPAMADLCSSTAETYLSEMPELLAAVRSEWSDGFTPHIPVIQKYATLLTERKQFDRAIEVCELAVDNGMNDTTQSGFKGRIERIKKAQAKVTGTSLTSVKTIRSPVSAAPLIQLPEAKLQPAVEVFPAQVWQTTLSLGFPEIDRLVAAGDWNSARAALQRIAYTMSDADAPTKAAFTSVMTKFASQDPLFAQVLNAALPAIEQSPGLKQADLYRDMSDDKKELIRYVLYFAAELGEIVRIKSGNSYALYPPGFALPLKATKQPKRKKVDVVVSKTTANDRRALMRERRAQMLLNTDGRPLWQLRAVRDGRDPPQCPGLNYPVYQWDDPFWETNGPWVCKRTGCRCAVRAYQTDEEVAL